MKTDELPPTETGVRVEEPQFQSCEYCGAVLKHINPCGNERNASMCLRRQKRND